MHPEQTAPATDEGLDFETENGHGDLSSVKARLEARREQLVEGRSELFDVPGYEGIIKVRYHALPHKRIRAISTRVEKQTRDPAEQELYGYADSLIHACDDLLEVVPGEDEPRSLGYKWGLAAARDLFGVHGLPDSTNARQALLAIFPQDAMLVTHAMQFDRWNSGVRQEADDELEEELGKAP